MNHDENNNKNPLEEDMKKHDNETSSEYSTTDSANNPPSEEENKHSEYQFSHQTELDSYANEPTNELENKSSNNNSEEAQTADSETKNATSKPKHKSQKRNLGISAIIGGLSGGLIAALTIVILLSSDIVSIGESPAEETSQSDSSSDTEEVISTNVSDDDNIDFSVDEATKAVVGVSRLQKANIWEPDQEAGTGSGIIYKKENDKAYVVTNHHVVAGAEDVQVTLSNEEKIPAKVLGSDELADLAVLEIDGS